MCGLKGGASKLNCTFRAEDAKEQGHCCLKKRRRRQGVKQKLKLKDNRIFYEAGHCCVARVCRGHDRFSTVLPEKTLFLSQGSS